MPLDYGLLAMFIITVIVMSIMLYLFIRSSERVDAIGGDKEGRILSVIRCSDGEKSREYREGDYVGKAVDDCPNGVIVGIYKEVPRQGR